MSLSRKAKRTGNRESGVTLFETLVALAILGTIAVVFLGGVIGSTKAAAIADEKATAGNLAQSQMEWVQRSAYALNANEYTPAEIPVGTDYRGFTVNIAAASLNITDDGIQKITVTVYRDTRQVFTLEGYKVDR